MGIYWTDEVFFGFSIDIISLLKCGDLGHYPRYTLGDAVHAKLRELGEQNQELAAALENVETRPEIDIHYWKVRFSYAKSKVERMDGRQQAVRPAVSAAQRASARVLLKALAPTTALDAIGTWAIRTVSTTYDLDDMVYCSVDALKRLGD